MGLLQPKGPPMSSLFSPLALKDITVMYSRSDGPAHINELRREDLDARFPGLLDLVLKEAEAEVG